MNNYSIVIQWSEIDNCFVAILPEWSDYNVSGENYETALANAKKTLNFLVEKTLAKGESLPVAKNFQL